MLLSCVISLLCLVISQGLNLPAEAPKGKDVEKPLRVGAFNIQNLGNSKFGNKELMSIIQKIILHYDLILIQEIVTLKSQFMDDLLRDLNKFAEDDAEYKMTVSERLGRGTAKEQYAYFYRSDRLVVSDAQVYPDEEDLFMRPPYIVKFDSPTTRDLTSFIAIGVHTQPKAAANETSSLAKVYDYASKFYSLKDAIIMGDMNAGCANVRISDWPNIELWTRKEFKWLIGHNADTTISITGCPYDRLIIAGDNINKCVVEETASIFNYKDFFEVNPDLIKLISDHWPVQVLFRGKVSSSVERNFKTNICFTLEDKRKVRNPMALYMAENKFGFKTWLLQDENDNEKSMIALLDNSDVTDLILNLTDVSDQFSQILSHEALEAIKYKIKFRALEDASSFQFQHTPEYSAKIECDLQNRQCSVLICSKTFVN